MGVKCKVIRGKNNRIEVVEAPNGEASILYNSLLNHVGNQEAALDLWTMPYTIGFNNLYGNWQVEQTGLSLDSNGEPTIQEVLKYSKLLRTQGKKLTNEQLSAISNNLYSLEINDIETLYKEIRNTFYKRGYFEINKKALEESNLYTNLEVLEIISNPTLQKSIKDLIERIEIEYLSENSTNINRLISTYFFKEEDLVIDTREVVGIGKYKALNPFIVSKQIADKVAGIKDLNVFSKKVDEIPYPAIVDKFKNDSVFASVLFNRYSNLEVIPVLKQGEAGIQRKTTQDTPTLMKEVLLTDVSKEDFSDNLDLLDKIDNQIWESLPEEIKAILGDIESNLSLFNIDVVGLKDSYENNSREDIMNFLYEMDYFTDELNNTFVQDDVINKISSSIDTFFERQPINSVEYIKPNQSNIGRTLVKITPISNELDLFNQESLIKTMEGLHHKVNVIQDKNILYNTIYDLVINDPSLLPKEAYYPSSFSSDNTLNLGKLRDETNKDLVISDIKRYVQKQMGLYPEVISTSQMDSLEKLTLYKLLFKHPLVSPEVKSKKEFYSDVLNFKGSPSYLKGEFINDFYQEILANKVNDNQLFKDVYSHFKIDELGISLENTDIHTKQQLKLLLPSNQLISNLKDYALLSKDSNLRDLFDYPNYSEESFIKKDLDTVFYSNNITSLPLFKGNYTKETDFIVVKNGLEDFIRTKEGLFKRLAQHGNLSFYVNVPINNDSVYYNFEVNSSDSINLNLDKYSKSVDTKLDNYISTDNIYSRKELEIINKEIDECR